MEERIEADCVSRVVFREVLKVFGGIASTRREVAQMCQGHTVTGSVPRDYTGKQQAKMCSDRSEVAFFMGEDRLVPVEVLE